MRNLRPWFSTRRFVMLPGILVLGALMAYRFVPIPHRKAQVATSPHHRIVRKAQVAILTPDPIIKRKVPAESENRFPINDLFVYFHEHGVEFERDERLSDWWVVTRPAAGDLEVTVTFMSFSPSENQQQMLMDVMPYSFSYILNAPAHLAMSYPRLQKTRPDSAIQSPDDGVTQEKLLDLFKRYRPSSPEPNRDHGAG